MLYYGNNLSEYFRNILIIVIWSQLLYSAVALMPLVSIVEKMHDTSGFFIRLQYNLNAQNISTKVKVMLLNERILNQRKICLTAGPFGPITKKTLFDVSTAG